MGSAGSLGLEVVMTEMGEEGTGEVGEEEAVEVGAIVSVERASEEGGGGGGGEGGEGEEGGITSGRPDFSEKELESGSLDAEIEWGGVKVVLKVDEEGRGEEEGRKKGSRTRVEIETDSTPLRWQVRGKFEGLWGWAADLPGLSLGRLEEARETKGSGKGQHARAQGKEIR
ncbi:hypothetical protein BJ684DRAFT_15921 [Piptocephalis cylindrospora]|uniref:Uncharacterized protein n=1 Tax=Piptocephalis cylindrospora TaxID=1907219 RepID=A0A4P9Y412_9FUNG|nr:hypothetical protein BJ684DRAFT_15921 [Piptocephalis cylindrospora]|eukprot:RKP13708.1 hypothetical protein BJ684DRAFT_15921 [Piptocephalis cylindrospora]